MVTHSSEHTCEVKVQSTGINLQVKLMKNASFEYYHELTPESKVFDEGYYLLLAGLPVPWTVFLYKRKTNSKSYRR